MRFIVMHKSDATMEAGTLPSPEIFKNMGALVQSSIKEGIFTNGAGLHRSAVRVRVEFRGGERSVERGPFKGKNEIVGHFAMIKAPSIDHAVERAAEMARIIGDVDIEIGPVVEPWDLGVMKKPDGGDGTSRFLLLVKGDAPRGLEALEKRWTDEGICSTVESIAPGITRLAAGKGKRAWVDGPFAESKELIAGFSILELPNKAAAIAWADRYAAILDGNEVDVRELS